MNVLDTLNSFGTGLSPLSNFRSDNRSAAPAAWRGGFGTCVQGGRPQTQIPDKPPTKDTTSCSWRGRALQPGNGHMETRAARLGWHRSQAVAGTGSWHKFRLGTPLASQIIPPRKYSPCPRARMQDPTGPGPGIRTGPGRTPGRTAAAAHHPRHRTETTLGDFTPTY